MSLDLRRHLRVPLRVEVQLGGESVSSEPDYAINISRGGLCLQTATPRPVGALLRLTFELPPNQKRIDTAAEVIWCLTPAQRSEGMRFYEMGLRFLGLSPSTLRAIDRFVEELTSAWPDA